MGTVGITTESAATIEQRRVKEFAERGKGTVTAVVGRGCGENQAVGAPGQNFGKAAALRIFTILRRTQVHAVVSLVDYGDVVAGAFQLIEDALLLEKVNGDQRKRGMIEGVGAKFGAAPDLFHAGTVDHVQAQSEAFTHLRLPLVQQWAGG